MLEKIYLCYLRLTYSCKHLIYQTRCIDNIINISITTKLPKLMRFFLPKSDSTGDIPVLVVGWGARTSVQLSNPKKKEKYITKIIISKTNCRKLLFWTMVENWSNSHVFHVKNMWINSSEKSSWWLLEKLTHFWG